MKIINLKSNKGFTILEIFLSVSLITAIAAIGIPVYREFQVRNDLDLAANGWVSALRRASILSQGVDGDTSWGAKVQSGNVTLFKGASYVLRDADFDETYDMPITIIASGLDEVVFSKFTGLPSVAGTTTLATITEDTRTITINVKGTVTY